MYIDGTQDLVMTTSPDEIILERELLGLTRAQVSAQFGEVRWPN